MTRCRFFYAETYFCSARPNIPVAMQSKSVVLKNMFDPEQ